MKRIDLLLSEFTFAQKLNLMEEVWGDLAMDEKRLKSPVWHKTVIEDRKKALAAGKITKSDWEEAKKRIRKNISCE